jgi:hypothetical protein
VLSRLPPCTGSLPIVTSAFCTQKLKSYLRGEQELVAVDQITHKRPLEPTIKLEPAIKPEAPSKVRRKDMERNLRSRENLLIIAHKDFSNVLEVYNAAERVYTEEIKVLKNTKVLEILFPLVFRGQLRALTHPWCRKRILSRRTSHQAAWKGMPQHPSSTNNWTLKYMVIKSLDEM